MLPSGRADVDWEAELAFVVARGGRHIPPGDALDHLAGYTVAQDVSERRLQMAAGGSSPWARASTLSARWARPW